MQEDDRDDDTIVGQDKWGIARENSVTAATEGVVRVGF